jgi:hypothetical protein
MTRRFARAVLLAALLIAWATPASAQDYSFSLDRESVHVFWNPDGTVALDYVLSFTNQAGAHAIDFVDVGLPNADFDYASVTADVDGVAVPISRDYQGDGTGVAVDLGSQTIFPGQSGNVHVYIGRVGGLLVADSQNPDNAVGDFAPLRFWSQSVVGTTDMTVVFHLPPGVKPDEPRWGSAPSGFPAEPAAGLDAEGRVTYTWRSSNARASEVYLFKVSFPRAYVAADSLAPSSPSVPRDSGALTGVLCLVLFGLIWVGIAVLVMRANQRRKLKYVPPKIAIEGHGIKRGLTAVEAAIVLERPLDKVMTMILFAVIKKGAAKVVKSDPLQLEILQPPAEGLRDYETRFLKAFQEDQVSQRRQELQEAIVALVKSVSEKMKGFSRSETIAYYQRIVETAWAQVQTAQTPEVQGEYFEKELEWTMLDKDYEERSKRVFRGPVYVPNWWGNYDPAYVPASSGGGRSALPAKVGQGGGPSLPQLPGADFAARVAGSVQTFSSKVVGNITDFTGRVAGVTNPLPKPASSSGGYRGGGGCACACACACAGCACACAGGGR